MVVLGHSALPSPLARQSESPVDWIRLNAIRLATREAGHGFATSSRSSRQIGAVYPEGEPYAFVGDIVPAESFDALLFVDTTPRRPAAEQDMLQLLEVRPGSVHGGRGAYWAIDYGIPEGGLLRVVSGISRIEAAPT